MKRLRPLILVSAFCFLLLTGCASLRNASYQTLYGVGHATQTALDAYLDLVVTQKISDRDLPKVAAAWGQFQTTYHLALVLAQLNPQAPVTGDVVAAQATVLQTIQRSLETAPLHERNRPHGTRRL